MAEVPGDVAGEPSVRAPRRLASGPWRAPLLIFAVSISIQGFLLSKVPEDWVRPNTDWELPALAASLATTGRFADAYALPTGPTAHLPPIHPAIYGAIYRLFGLTVTAGYVTWFVDMATWSVLWALLPWVARRVGLCEPAGVLAGVAGALIPRWPGHGEALAAIAMCLLAGAFARRWSLRATTSRGSLLLGLSAGAAFHVQPALLLVVAGWVSFELWWKRTRSARGFTALLVAGMVLACVPWGWRNYRAFDALFFVRSNFGLEFRMGNHEGAEASMDAMDRKGNVHLHPRSSEEEARKVQAMGEAAYMRAAGREAMDWVASHPAAFAELTAKRVAFWWLGPPYDPVGAAATALVTMLALVGAWRALPALAVPARAALLVPPLAYPLVYYVVAYMPRYREPLDWILLLAAGEAVWRWVQRGPHGPR